MKTLPNHIVFSARAFFGAAFMVLLLSAFSSTAAAQSWWPFGGGKTGSGNIMSNDREPGTFTGVAVQGSGDVFVTQGDSFKVRVDVDDNLVEDVKTEVSGDVLHIGMKNGRYNNVHLKVYVTMPKLTSLAISGSGDIRVQSPFAMNDLKTSISGSGDIRFSGGKATSHRVQISGSGDVDAMNLEAEQAEVSISGSGDCALAVAKKLDVRIAGSGDVLYKGSPSINQRIAGSGSVRQR